MSRKTATEDKKLIIKSENHGKEIKIKNVGGRPKKADKYKEERFIVLNKLNKILGITEENKQFYMCDIDEEKQKEITDLKDDIGKYFGGKHTSAFLSDDTKREYFSLIRIVYKEMGFSFIRKVKTITRNNIKSRSACYYIWDKEVPSF